MPEIIMISSMLSEENFASISHNSKGAISNANSNFQHCILEGLKAIVPKDINIRVFNIPNIGAFPFKYRKPLYKGIHYRKKNVIFNEITFLNIPKLKHKVKKYFLKHNLGQTIKQFVKPPIIIVYDLDYSLVSAVTELRDKGYQFICINVIPDLPGMTGSVDHPIYRLLQRKNCTQVIDAKYRMDGYVLLSNFMRQPLNIEDIPYIIMEGIYTLESANYILPDIPSIDYPYILYTGALDERNGVKHLIQAFSSLNIKDVNLVLCGDGELRDWIENKTFSDHRIKYLGQVRHEIAVALQKKAKCLINPRLASQNFAKYSFPSKTMEYLASGVPLIMYPLESLPSEYLEYINIPEDESVHTLTQTLERVLTDDYEKYTAKGKRAKKFILSFKTADKQMCRIIEFAQMLYRKKYGDFN